MKKNKQVLKKSIIYILLANITISIAQTNLPSFFSDNMVLQQNKLASIWGVDEPGVTVKVSGNWGEESITSTDKNGHWKLRILTPRAGGPYNVTIKGSEKIMLNNVMIGEVWLCSGQSNMEMPVKGFSNQPVNGSNEAILNSYNYQVRLFSVERNSSLEPISDVTGKWLISESSSVKDFSAIAYFFGKKLQAILNVPIGLIHTSWGGSNVEAWMDKQTLSEFKTITIPELLPEEQTNKTPTLLYNAMINPLVGYTIKGIIWYQGEANRNRPNEYKQLFPTMIKSWRKKWQQERLAFYFVQIAPFRYKGKDENSAFLREVQLHTMQTVNNTGMVVTMDIGDCNYIHPREKKLVGDRLAYWALSKNYNIDGIAYSGPIYKEMHMDDNKKIKLLFDFNSNGLSSFGKKLIGFEIAGEDKLFYSAQAIINRDKSVTVWSEEVEAPVAVRYAFNNCTEGTLFNTEGLPASSFRTDGWDR